MMKCARLLAGSLSGMLLLGLSVEAAATDISWERISGHRSSGAYGWDYAYELGFFSDVLTVDLDIMLLGDVPDASLLDTWELGIEHLWSTGRFSVPISFNVDWVTGNYDQAVTVHNGDGNPNMINWYTGNPAGWGYSFQDEVAAHEAGHMFGVYDEYSGGAVEPVTGAVNTGGLMQTLTGATLDYYYTEMLAWYYKKTDYVSGGPVQAASNAMQGGTPVASVPEPSTILLLGSGLAGFALMRRPRTR